MIRAYRKIIHNNYFKKFFIFFHCFVTRIEFIDPFKITIFIFIFILLNLIIIFITNLIINLIINLTNFYIYQSILDLRF